MTDFYRRTGKRVLDIAVSAVCLLGSLPVIAVLALLSFVMYRSWPMFSHDRVGYRGRRFRISKIRTLPSTVAAYADKYDLTEVRLPRLMSWIRRTHLDELPQLFHVLTGRMSLVGPRPEMTHLLERLPPGSAGRRQSVRPGITGLWQISPHSSGLIFERPEYDDAYVDHVSLRLDLWVLASTVRTTLFRRTFDLDDIPVTVSPAPSPLAPDQATATLTTNN